MIHLQVPFTNYTDFLLREIKTNLSKLVLAFYHLKKIRQTTVDHIKNPIDENGQLFIELVFKYKCVVQA